MDEPSLAAEAPVPLKLIPMREVRKHRSPGDVWLVAFDLVIDVSSFAEVHPGGADIIHTMGGKDATAIFRSFKHSEAAKHSLWDYTVGALDPNDYLVEEDHRCIAEIEAVLSEPGHSEQTYEAARRIRTHMTPTWLNLNLGNLELGDDGAVVVSRILRHSPAMVRKVMMEGNAIGPRGAIALADMLRVNTDITVLILQNNEIGDEGAVALAGALRENESLQILGLPTNFVGDEGGSALGRMLAENKVLRVLSLKHNDVGDAAAADLAAGLQDNVHLEGLNLSFTRVSDDGVEPLAAAVARNRKLRHLWLGGNAITDVGLQHINRGLAENRHIEQVRLTVSQDMYAGILTGRTGSGFQLLGVGPHRTSVDYKAGVPYQPRGESAQNLTADAGKYQLQADADDRRRSEYSNSKTGVWEGAAAAHGGLDGDPNRTVGPPRVSPGAAAAGGALPSEAPRPAPPGAAAQGEGLAEVGQAVPGARGPRGSVERPRASLEITRPDEMRARGWDRRLTIDFGGAPPPAVN